MLVKLARVRCEKNMQECVREAQDAGRKYINVANDILGNV
jgi:PTS system mannose-specific IIA component